MKNLYPVYKPSLLGNEKKYVNECIDTTWISSKGEFIEKFETGFAKYTGIKHAASVCNGTVALHLALLALNIGPDDEVIVPTLTYIASVNAIKYVGAKPVFVDSKYSDWQMDPEDIKRKISAKTKAVMAVHLYGDACEMDQIMHICKSNSLFLIEDCAEAIGTKYESKHVGTFGDVASFSFFGNKTITTGEGGMVVSNNKEIYDKIVHLKGQGLAKNREYWHDIVGYNYRMTNICAAIGFAQLEQINSFVSKKKEIAKWYKSNLNITEISFSETSEKVENTYWMVSIVVNTTETRDQLRNHLSSNEIETRPFFHTAHSMPAYFLKDGKFPVAENLSKTGLNLPSYPDLNQKDVEYICDKIKDFFKNMK